MQSHCLVTNWTVIRLHVYYIIHGHTYDINVYKRASKEEAGRLEWEHVYLGIFQTGWNLPSVYYKR